MRSDRTLAWRNRDVSSRLYPGDHRPLQLSAAMRTHRSSPNVAPSSKRRRLAGPSALMYGLVRRSSSERNRRTIDERRMKGNTLDARHCSAEILVCLWTDQQRRLVAMLHRCCRQRTDWVCSFADVSQCQVTCDDPVTIVNSSAF